MPVDTIDEALAPHVIGEQLYDIAINQWGSTHAQADDFSKLYRDRFALKNGVAYHQETKRMCQLRLSGRRKRCLGMTK